METGPVQTKWGILPDAVQVASKEGSFPGTGGTIVEVVQRGEPRRTYFSTHQYDELEGLALGWQRQNDNFLFDRNMHRNVVCSVVIDLAPRGHNRNAECVILYPLYPQKAK
jgi:hypothetical protein